MNELGFSLVEDDDPDFDHTMRVATSTITDVEKFEQLGVGQPADESGGDLLLQLLADRSIDPLTAGLLGRFIAEERDSGRILQAAYQQARGGTPPQLAPAATLDDVREQLEQLSRVVSHLQHTES